MRAMNSVEQLFTGIFGTLVFVLAIVVVIYWLVFPIIVARYLKEILHAQRQVAEHLKVLRGEYEAQLKKPPTQG
jgi:flagellar biogenesis protein FliO